MREVEAVKTEQQRSQIGAHLIKEGQIYADIWKIGVNTGYGNDDWMNIQVI